MENNINQNKEGEVVLEKGESLLRSEISLADTEIISEGEIARSLAVVGDEEDNESGLDEYYIQENIDNMDIQVDNEGQNRIPIPEIEEESSVASSVGSTESINNGRREEVVQIHREDQAVGGQGALIELMQKIAERLENKIEESREETNRNFRDNREETNRNFRDNREETNKNSERLEQSLKNEITKECEKIKVRGELMKKAIEVVNRDPNKEVKRVENKAGDQYKNLDKQVTEVETNTKVLRDKDELTENNKEIEIRTEPIAENFKIESKGVQKINVESERVNKIQENNDKNKDFEIVKNNIENDQISNVINQENKILESRVIKTKSRRSRIRNRKSKNRAKKKFVSKIFPFCRKNRESRKNKLKRDIKRFKKQMSKKQKKYKSKHMPEIKFKFESKSRVEGGINKGKKVSQRVNKVGKNKVKAQKSVKFPRVTGKPKIKINLNFGAKETRRIKSRKKFNKANTVCANGRHC